MISVPIEVEAHTISHFKAQINARLDFYGLEPDGTFTLYYRRMKIGRLL